MLSLRTLVLAALTLCCGAGIAAGVEFQPTIEAARKKEAAATAMQRRPVVVVFTSASCVWCRKMEVDTFPDDRVAKVAGSFLWVKADVEQQEELAARYNVRELPHTVVLNGEDRVIAAQPGYLPPERFVAFLDEALKNPQPIDDVLPSLLEKLDAAKEPKQREETITRIVERLASADREGRTAALEALTKAGPNAWPVLLSLMSDQRLAVRAAAGSVLARATKSEVAFDPFAAEELRVRQVGQLREWISAQSGPAERPPH